MVTGVLHGIVSPKGIMQGLDSRSEIVHGRRRCLGLAPSNERTFGNAGIMKCAVACCCISNLVVASAPTLQTLTGSFLSCRRHEGDGKSSHKWISLLHFCLRVERRAEHFPGMAWINPMSKALLSTAFLLEVKSRMIGQKVLPTV